MREQVVSEEDTQLENGQMSKRNIQPGRGTNPDNFLRT